MSFELEVPPNDRPTVQHVDFTNMSESELIAALKSLPKDIADFAGFVRDEIEKIEKPRHSRSLHKILARHDGLEKSSRFGAGLRGAIS